MNYHRDACAIHEHIRADGRIYDFFMDSVAPWGEDTHFKLQVLKWQIMDESEHICNCDRPTVADLVKEIDVRHSNKVEISYRHIFLTISLPTDYDCSTLHNFDPSILKLADSKNQNDFTWCFEFFGAQLQYHPHIHLLVKTKSKLDKKRLIGRLAKSFKIETNFIDYICSHSKLQYNKRLAYLHGDKTDTKTPQLIKDEEYRVSLKLKSHYTL